MAATLVSGTPQAEEQLVPPGVVSKFIDRAAKMIQDALGTESDDVVNYCFPKQWRATATDAPPSSASGSRPRAPNKQVQVLFVQREPKAGFGIAMEAIQP
jgi:hypothetical protein